MATIELGELTDRDERSWPDPPLPPGAYRLWRRLGRVTVRRLAAAAVLVPMLGVTAVAADRPEPVLTEVFSAALGGRGDFRLAGNVLLAARVQADHGTLTAYRLADGARRWQVRIDGVQAQEAYVAVDGLGAGLVSLVVGRHGIGPAWTEVYDLRTGDRLLGRPGAPLFGRGEDLVFGQRLTCGGPGGCPPGAAWSGEELVGVGGRTGETRWTLRLPQDSRYGSSFDWGLAAPAAAGRLAVLTPDGVLTVRDVRTGVQTGRRTVPPSELGAPLQVYGDLVLLATAEGITAYHADRLEPAWTVRLGSPESLGGGWPCGRLLCVSGPDGTHAIDPATGTVRWWLAGRHILGTAGDRYALAYRMPDGGSGERPRAEAEVVSIETGQQVSTTGSWEPGPPPQTLMQRWNDTRTRVWLGELLPGNTYGVRTIGSIAGVRDHCVVDVPFLACPAPDFRVRVWRLAERGPGG